MKPVPSVRLVVPAGGRSRLAVLGAVLVLGAAAVWVWQIRSRTAPARDPTPAPPTLQPTAFSGIPATPAGRTNQPPLIATSSNLVQWTALVSPEIRRALRQGDRRLVITVLSYMPSDAGGSSLVVSLVHPDRSKRTEIGRFGVHPDQAFDVDQGGRPQRFMFSLAAWNPESDSDPLMVEVGFDAQGESTSGVHARLEFQLIEIHPN